MKTISILTISRNEQNVKQLCRSLSRQNLHGVDLHVSWNGEEFETHWEKNYAFPIYVHKIAPYHFASNNNELARQAKGELLLFVNDDVTLDDNSLGQAMAFLENDKIGIVSINLRYRNETVQHAGLYFKPDGSPYHRYKHAVHYTDPRVQGTEIVPAVTGAFLLLRAADFRKVQFDESFQVAGEDIVFCLALKRLLNKSILYCGRLTALHAENETRRVTRQRLTPSADLDRIRSAYFQLQPGIDGFRSNLLLRIVTEQEGWIMHRKAREIASRVPHSVINEDLPSAHIHYYINYGYFRERPKQGIVVANFTHYDPSGLGNRFFEVAEAVDHCVSVSNQTTDLLLAHGISASKITTIPVGADSSYRPKLTIGVVGRTYPGGRKGERIVAQLAAEEEFAEDLKLVSTNDCWNVQVWDLPELSDFYRAIDYLLVPASIEGGPVPFMEALACGTLSIAPPIGVVPDFPHIAYETGDYHSLKKVVRELIFRHKVKAEPLVSQIQNLNWDNWAERHLRLFERLLFT